MRIIISFCSIVFLFSACEKDAGIPLPKAEPKMALTCFLEPDSLIQVIIARVNPIFNNALPEFPDYITDATVFMSDGTDTVQLTLEPTTQAFYQDAGNLLSIKGGAKYWVWASAPGMPSVSATTSIPDLYIGKSGINYKLSAFKQGSDSAFQLQVSWKDIPNTKNYYRVQPWLIDSVPNTFGFSDYLLSYSSARDYIDDIDRDGTLLDFVSETLTFFADGSNRTDITSRVLRIYMLTTSEEYYKYHLSLANYSGDSPFVNPSNRYTNIKGGYGVFCGYRMITAYYKIF